MSEPTSSKPSGRVGRVAIIGAGLIGGSLGAALGARGLATERVAYDSSPDARQRLVPTIADRVASSIAEACDGAELVVVACPVTALDEVFARIGRHAPPDCLVTDCTSTKRTAIAAARAGLGSLFERFVPGHPIAGSERSGPLAARPELFSGKAWLLCPLDAAQSAAADRLAPLLTAVGASVERMDAGEHDAMFAEFSHWPHAVVFALCAAVARGGYGALAARFSGAGLRDTTRIGASSPDLWADILLDNREAVLASASRFAEALDALRDRLENGVRGDLVELLAAGSEWRRTLD
ncbi:MAG: prephenate dehydrogenase/arogenate dehydrogenase family protein [Burkholderiaceae bacterium]|nr:prephenate dehydrogenase/arogenate dehydrogenase family protein [Burkholderiaceae bacterium]